MAYLSSARKMSDSTKVLIEMSEPVDKSESSGLIMEIFYDPEEVKQTNDVQRK